uniref:Histone deacetylase complex subunit SAP25 n=1 Tax=Balaenoptera musculus TaxID=9771 RepID=A0A8C0DKJ5_BALMU
MAVRGFFLKRPHVISVSRRKSRLTNPAPGIFGAYEYKGSQWGHPSLGEPRTPHRTVFSPGPEGLPGSERAAAALAAPRPGCQAVPRNPSSPLPTDDLGGGPVKDDPAGTSFSGRTSCHPSFWPLYKAASGRGLRSSLTGHQSGEQAPRDAGFPVICCEGHVPLYLSQGPQQVMDSLKLLLPPPIMSPSVLPIPSSGCSTAWLSGPEPIALTGLLQMSQGEPRPSSPGAPKPPAGPPDPASDHPGASGGHSCSQCTDPSLPRAPDNQGP